MKLLGHLSRGRRKAEEAGPGQLGWAGQASAGRAGVRCQHRSSTCSTSAPIVCLVPLSRTMPFTSTPQGAPHQPTPLSAAHPPTHWHAPLTCGWLMSLSSTIPFTSAVSSSRPPTLPSSCNQGVWGGDASARDRGRTFTTASTPPLPPSLHHHPPTLIRSRSPRCSRSSHSPLHLGPINYPNAARHPTYLDQVEVDVAALQVRNGQHCLDAHLR